jgi:hypothetical protein
VANIFQSISNIVALFAALVRIASARQADGCRDGTGASRYCPKPENCSRRDRWEKYHRIQIGQARKDHRGRLSPEPPPLRATRLQRLVTDNNREKCLESHENPGGITPGTLENQRIGTNLVWVKFHVFQGVMFRFLWLQSFSERSGSIRRLLCALMCASVIVTYTR